MTLVGRARRLAAGAERDTAKEAYLAAQPNARYYIDYSDFACWRVEVEAVRYIGGYGRMSWVELGEYRSASPTRSPHTPARSSSTWTPITARPWSVTAAPSPRRPTRREPVMSSVDRYGFELSATTARGPRPIRLAFSTEVATPDDARRELVELARRAREAQAWAPD